MTIIQVESNTEEWHKLRHEDLTASELPAWYDPTAFKTKLALYYEKRSKNPPKPYSKNDGHYIRLEAGKYLESFVARMFGEYYGIELSPFEGYARHDSVEHFAATPDYVHPAVPLGQILDEVRGHEHLQYPITNEDGPGLVEIKTDLFNPSSDEPPIKHLVQLQAQLACTGYKWGMILTLTDLSILDVAVYRVDPVAIADIIKNVREFWHWVDNDIQPPLSKSDASILRDMYSDIVGEEVDMTDNIVLLDSCQAWADANEKYKAYDNIVQMQKTLILDQIKEHSNVVCGAFKISRSKFMRSEKVTKENKKGQLVKYRLNDPEIPEDMLTAAEVMKERGVKSKKVGDVVYSYDSGIDTTSLKIREVI